MFYLLIVVFLKLFRLCAVPLESIGRYIAVVFFLHSISSVPFELFRECTWVEWDVRHFMFFQISLFRPLVNLFNSVSDGLQCDNFSFTYSNFALCLVLQICLFTVRQRCLFSLTFCVCGWQLLSSTNMRRGLALSSHLFHNNFPVVVFIQSGKM